MVSIFNLIIKTIPQRKSSIGCYKIVIEIFFPILKETRTPLWDGCQTSCRSKYTFYHRTLLLLLVSVIQKPQSIATLRLQLRSKPRFLVLKCLMNTGIGRSDRIRTCGIDVPNVARYQLRHTPMSEKYSIFRSISVSGQTCGQTAFYSDFEREHSAEKVNVYKGFRRFLFSRRV